MAREILASIRARFVLSLLASLAVPLDRAASRRSEPLRSFRRDFALALSGQSESIRKEVHVRSAGAPKVVAGNARRVGDVLHADWELPDERQRAIAPEGVSGSSAASEGPRRRAE